MTGSGRAAARSFVAVVGLLVAGPLSFARAETILVQAGSTMSWKANATDPGLGTDWIAAGFDDSSWDTGTYGVGYDTGGAPNATALLATTVPSGSYSVYTRTTFTVVSPASVANLFLGCDWDDGVVAWLNGVEIWRSAQMPAGSPAWNTNAGLHESSNGASPNYGTLVDVSAAALPNIVAGTNVLAVGVWNSGAPLSSDLVLVPKLVRDVGTGPAVVTRGPYLQVATPTSIRVRWRTSVATDSRVTFGPSPASLVGVADVAGLRTDHDVLVSGLAPESEVFYSVGTSSGALAGGDTNHHFRTPPLAGTDRPFRFWILGDAGTANPDQARVRDAFAGWNGGRRLDGLLLLGDNAYNEGTDPQYQAALFDMYPATLRTTPTWSTLGNHDGISADSATQSGPYYDLFTLPAAAEAGGLASGTEAWYSFDVGNVHFVCLESHETDRSGSGTMLTWLAADLAATTRDWIVAFWHHPPYTKGSHDSDVEAQLIEMRQNALPILEAAGVDLVLTGHSHSYERSWLIDGHLGSSGTFNPATHRKDPGGGAEDVDGPYRKATIGQIPHAGAVFAVAGSSGKISGGPLNHPAMFVSLNVLGSMALDVDGNRLDAFFVDDTGAVRDRFTMLKGAGRAPRPVPDGATVAGTPATAAKAGGALRLAWDVAACTPSTAYHLLHGFGSPGAPLVPSGARCGLGVLGRYDWTPPAMPVGESLLWWTVVGSDGLTREGTWGTDSAGGPEGSGPSGFCLASTRDLSATCP